MELPQSISVIDIGAFENCEKLESINLENVSSIENGAFRNCSSLKEVSLCPKMTKLSNCFVGCTSITSLVIPEGVKSISSIGCENLEYLYIPSTVTQIYSYAFSDLKKLEYIELPDQKQYWTYQYGMFHNCSSLKEFYTPLGADSVVSDMFNGCTSLEYIGISPSVTVIEDHAFANCDSLQMVYIPDSVTKIDDTAFGYAYDEDGNWTKTDQNIIIIVDSEDSTAAKYAEEHGLTPIVYNEIKDSYYYGDLNLDGIINIKDLNIMQKYLLGISRLADVQYMLSDINEDGVLNVYDLVLLKRLIINGQFLK